MFAPKVALLLASFFICSCLSIVVFDESSSTPKVNISGGELEGRFIETINGARAYVFQGIPFAEPPIGHLRFKKPVSKKPWNGTLVCQEYKAACYQNVTMSSYSTMSEDCLFINVFAGVQCTNETLCPVLFYIHGGAYEFESPSMFPADVLVENFATNGIVVVTVAYRLGVMGFWSTGTEEAIGNWAMEDMVEGAEWVQREIHHFGGNRFNVTVMGHSSSSMAVDLLMMSKRTVGLFDQAVMMSGSSSTSGSLSNDVSFYQKLSVEVGCASRMDWMRTSQFNKVVRCMRTIPVDELVNKFNEIRGCSPCTFPPSPITVPRNDGPRGLFPYSVERMLAERRPMNTLLGTTKNEDGLSKLKYINATAATVTERCDEAVEKLDFKRKRRISHECKVQYVVDADPASFNASVFSFWTEQAVNLAEDVMYFAPCFKDCTTLRSKGSTVYLYSFDYEKQGMEGVAPFHAQDLTYVMGSHQAPYDSRDFAIRSRYMPLFVNFIKYGNPTPVPVDNVTWVPLEPFGFNYLSVDIPVQMKPDYHKAGVLFWNYRAPAVDKVGAGPRTDLDMDTDILKYSRNVSGVEGSESETKHWRNAFWVVFVLLVAVVCTIVGVGVYFHRQKKNLTKRNVEKQSLLESFKDLDTYQSF